MSLNSCKKTFKYNRVMEMRIICMILFSRCFTNLYKASLCFVLPALEACYIHVSQDVVQSWSVCFWALPSSDSSFHLCQLQIQKHAPMKIKTIAIVNKKQAQGGSPWQALEEPIGVGRWKRSFLPEEGCFCCCPLSVE